VRGRSHGSTRVGTDEKADTPLYPPRLSTALLRGPCRPQRLALAKCLVELSMINAADVSRWGACAWPALTGEKPRLPTRPRTDGLYRTYTMTWIIHDDFSCPLFAHRFLAVCWFSKSLLNLTCSNFQENAGNSCLSLASGWELRFPSDSPAIRPIPKGGGGSKVAGLVSVKPGGHDEPQVECEAWRDCYDGPHARIDGNWAVTH